MGEMQGQGALEVAELLREGVRQSGEPSHLHSDREVLALDVGRRNEFDLGGAHERDGDSGLNAWWTIPRLSGAFGLVQLQQLGKVYTGAVPLYLYGVPIGAVQLGGMLGEAG